MHVHKVLQKKQKVYTKKTFSYETQNSGIFCNILRKKLSVIANFFLKVLPKLGRMFVSMYVCMYLCIYVIAIVATPFNLELSNFDITFLM